MCAETRWDERYRTGDLPWDTGRHDGNLERALAEGVVAPCAALEIGCGTGTNAIWLARAGFRVTALDVSAPAVDMARDKAAAEGADVEFLVTDILTDPVPSAPFGFVFDRGCFHSFDEPAERSTFARAVWGALADDGLWLSLIGSTDGPDREIGPPRRSLADIAAAVEPLFEILSARTTRFDSDQPDPPRAWACVMRKRATPAHL